MARARAFRALVLTRQFDRSFARLDEQRQEQCADALEQLITEPLAPALHLKPIQPHKVYWEARTNRGDRLILRPEGDIAHVLDVVPHDEIARWGKLRR